MVACSWPLEALVISSSSWGSSPLSVQIHANLGTTEDLDWQPPLTILFLLTAENFVSNGQTQKHNLVINTEDIEMTAGIMENMFVTSGEDQKTATMTQVVPNGKKQ